MLASVLTGARHMHGAMTRQSIAEWGDLRGTSMIEASYRMQPPDVARLVIESADRAMDTGETVRVEVPFAQMAGSIIWVPGRDALFSVWEWLTAPEPPEIASDLRLAVLAEHLQRLAWSLREGRPLPHVPAVLRAGPGPHR